MCRRSAASGIDSTRKNDPWNGGFGVEGAADGLAALEFCGVAPKNIFTLFWVAWTKRGGAFLEGLCVFSPNGGLFCGAAVGGGAAAIWAGETRTAVFSVISRFSSPASCGLASRGAKCTTGLVSADDLLLSKNFAVFEGPFCFSRRSVFRCGRLRRPSFGGTPRARASDVRALRLALDPRAADWTARRP